MTQEEWNKQRNQRKPLKFAIQEVEMKIAWSLHEGKPEKAERLKKTRDHLMNIYTKVMARKNGWTIKAETA